MAVKSSGALSFATDIVGEFSDSTPHSLSEFYKGGGKVPDAAGNGNVPTSGAISMGDFYGAVNRIAVSLTISSNTNNYNIFSSKGASYAAGVSDVTLTINSAVSVGSTSTGTYALETGTGWATGDTITIVNNGTVKGRGGNGGNGGAATGGINGGSGSTGGSAFRAQFATAFTNNGSVYGGGGGGGGGGRYIIDGIKGSPDVIYGGGGGGGGAGVNGGTGGNGGAGVHMDGQNGSSGTSSSGGAGGLGGVEVISSGSGGSKPGNGGAGGGLGSAGSAGLNGGASFGLTEGQGGSGGARGNYQVGASFINSGSGIGGTVGGGSS
jgi:hypothetical protein